MAEYGAITISASWSIPSVISIYVLSWIPVFTGLSHALPSETINTTTMGSSLEGWAGVLRVSAEVVPSELIDPVVSFSAVGKI